MLLPDSLRQQLHVEEGGQVVIREVGGALVLESLGEAVIRAQAIVRQYAPTASAVAEELIADRRADAARE
jgi:antitoxin component of MazEF toxin-antitoxin module